MGEHRRRPVVALTLFLVAVVALAPLAPASASGPETRDEAAAREGADRVLLMAMPGLTWADVADHDLPHIEAFLEGAAVANHAPRGVHAASRPGAAYLTISAGTRTIGLPSTDGQLLALDDRSAGSAAGEIFERRTSVTPEGDYVVLNWANLYRRNTSHPYDPELGLLQATLAEAGLGAGVVANADGTDTIAASYERQAGLAVATPDGEVLHGDLDVDLLVAETARPFGLRMDVDRAAERVGEQWGAPGGRGGGGGPAPPRRQPPRHRRRGRRRAAPPLGDRAHRRRAGRRGRVRRPADRGVRPRAGRARRRGGLRSEHRSRRGRGSLTGDGRGRAPLSAVRPAARSRCAARHV
jgi:hypothetical protein